MALALALAWALAGGREGAMSEGEGCDYDIDAGYDMRLMIDTTMLM